MTPQQFSVCWMLRRDTQPKMMCTFSPDHVGPNAIGVNILRPLAASASHGNTRVLSTARNSLRADSQLCQQVFVAHCCHLIKGTLSPLRRGNGRFCWKPLIFDGYVRAFSFLGVLLCLVIGVSFQRPCFLLGVPHVSMCALM